MDFRVLQQLLTPDKTGEDIPKEPRSTDDEQNIIDAKQKMRSGMAPAGNPEQDKPLEQPWYSPDELIAGAAAPGIQKGLQKGVPIAFNALKSMGQAAPELLGNEAGYIFSRKQAQDALKNSLDPETRLVDYKKLIDQAFAAEERPGEGLENLSRLHGTAILDATGKNETRQGIRDAVNEIMPSMTNTDVLYRQLKGYEGSYNPGTKLVTIKSNLSSPLSEASAVGHEGVHRVENILKPSFDPRPYTTNFDDPNAAKPIIDLLNENPRFMDALIKKARTEQPTGQIELTPEHIEYLRKIGILDNPNRYVHAVTGQHSIVYPTNIEAQQTAHIRNKALQGQPLNLQPDFAKTFNLLNKKK